MTMHDKKGFFPVIIFLILLVFSLSGCGKKQEVNPNVGSDKGMEEQTIPQGRLQPDTETREIVGIKEVPKSKKDIEKYLEDLEKNFDKIDVNTEEEDEVIDDLEIDDSDINIEEDNDVDDSDIDAL